MLDTLNFNFSLCYDFRSLWVPPRLNYRTIKKTGINNCSSDSNGCPWSLVEKFAYFDDILLYRDFYEFVRKNSACNRSVIREKYDNNKGLWKQESFCDSNVIYSEYGYSQSFTHSDSKCRDVHFSVALSDFIEKSTYIEQMGSSDYFLDFIRTKYPRYYDKTSSEYSPYNVDPSYHDKTDLELLELCKKYIFGNIFSPQLNYNFTKVSQ